MKCRKLHAYETGRMTAADFAGHCRECPDCAARATLDVRLDAEIRALKNPVAGGTALWDRIEVALEEEKARPSVAATAVASVGRPATTRRRLTLLRWLGDRRLLAPAGAAAFCLLAAATFLTLKGGLRPSGILAARALSRVESREKEYLAAIGDLERTARPKLEAMDLQIASLYRDKISSVDAQIEKCREALASNPANAHIRRYLLAALQDKRQTLADVLGPENSTKKPGRNS